MVIVLTTGLGDRCSIPSEVIPNTQKTVLGAFNTQYYRIWIKNKKSNVGKEVAPSPTPRCCSYWKRELSGNPRLQSANLQTILKMEISKFKSALFRTEFLIAFFICLYLYICKQLYQEFLWNTTKLRRVLASRIERSSMVQKTGVLIPGRVIPKPQKMLLDAALLNTQHYFIRIKGEVEQSREWSSAPLHLLKKSFRGTLD